MLFVFFFKKWSCVLRNGVIFFLTFSILFYFIPSSEFNIYLKQIKITLSAVKKCRISSLVMNTIYIFSL